MKRLSLVAAALVAAAIAAPAFAADKVDPKAAQKQYKEAVAKAKSEFDKSIAACKKQPEAQQHACYKAARKTRNDSREAASDAYLDATGRPDPSPGV